MDSSDVEGLQIDAITTQGVSPDRTDRGRHNNSIFAVLQDEELDPEKKAKKEEKVCAHIQSCCRMSGSRSRIRTCTSDATVAPPRPG